MPAIPDILPLESRWRITRQHLDSAIQAIRAQNDSPEIQSCLASAADFLAHNELECALHDLECACEHFTPSPETWELLAVAADSMSLSERASGLRRLATAPTTEPNSNETGIA